MVTVSDVVEIDVFNMCICGCKALYGVWVWDVRVRSAMVESVKLPIRFRFCGVKGASVQGSDAEGLPLGGGVGW